MTAKSPHDRHGRFPVVSDLTSKTLAPFPPPPGQMGFRCGGSVHRPSPHRFPELTRQRLPAVLRRHVLSPQGARGAQGLLFSRSKPPYLPQSTVRMLFSRCAIEWKSHRAPLQTAQLPTPTQPSGSV